MKKIRKKFRKIKEAHPQVDIYSFHPKNLVIIDQEHELLVTISAKGRIRKFPLPQ